MRLKQREQERNNQPKPCKIRAALERSGGHEETALRFNAKIIRGEGDGCWSWAGSVSRNGYGSFRLPSPSREVIGAHRVAYFLANGEIPTGMLIRHKCDNPKCVNPGHLELGTKADNSRDMVSRGRMPKRDQSGENNGAAKLKASEVAVIKAQFQQGRDNNSIAAEYGVSSEAISRIRLGKSWASVHP